MRGASAAHPCVLADDGRFAALHQRPAHHGDDRAARRVDLAQQVAVTVVKRVEFAYDPINLRIAAHFFSGTPCKKSNFILL